MVDVSVLMAVGNFNPYLERSICLSLKAMSQEDELVIAQDGANTEVDSLLKKISDKRVIWIRRDENLGIRATRNELMNAAKGKYFAIMDSDDFAGPRRFSLAATILSHGGFDYVFGNAWLRYGHLFSMPLVPAEAETEDIARALLFRNILIHSTMTGRAEVMRSVGYEADYAEDYKHYLKALGEGHKMYLTRKSLTTYNVHQDQATQILRQNSDTRVRAELMDEIENFVDAPKHDYFDSSVDAWEKLRSSNPKLAVKVAGIRSLLKNTAPPSVLFQAT